MGLFSNYDLPENKNRRPRIVYGSITLKIVFWTPQTYLHHWLFEQHPIQKLVKKRDTLDSRQKWVSHFGPLGHEKRPKWPVSGDRREKPNRRLRRHQNFGRFTRWSFSDWFINGLNTTIFYRKPVFTDRWVRIHWAGGTKLPFRCNSLRQLDKTNCQTFLQSATVISMLSKKRRRRTAKSGKKFQIKSWLVFIFLKSEISSLSTQKNILHNWSINTTLLIQARQKDPYLTTPHIFA